MAQTFVWISLECELSSFLSGSVQEVLQPPQGQSSLVKNREQRAKAPSPSSSSILHHLRAMSLFVCVSF